MTPVFTTSDHVDTFGNFGVAAFPWIALNTTAFLISFGGDIFIPVPGDFSCLIFLVLDLRRGDTFFVDFGVLDLPGVVFFADETLGVTTGETSISLIPVKLVSANFFGVLSNLLTPPRFPVLARLFSLAALLALFPPLTDCLFAFFAELGPGVFIMSSKPDKLTFALTFLLGVLRSSLTPVSCGDFCCLTLGDFPLFGDFAGVVFGVLAGLFALGDALRAGLLAFDALRAGLLDGVRFGVTFSSAGGAGTLGESLLAGLLAGVRLGETLFLALLTGLFAGVFLGVVFGLFAGVFLVETSLSGVGGTWTGLFAGLLDGVFFGVALGDALLTGLFDGVVFGVAAFGVALGDALLTGLFDGVVFGVAAFGVALGDALLTGLFDGVLFGVAAFLAGDAGAFLGVVFGDAPFPLAGEPSSLIGDAVLGIAMDLRFSSGLGESTCPEGRERRCGVFPFRTGVLGGKCLSNSSGLILGPNDTRFLLALGAKSSVDFLFLGVLFFFPTENT